MRKEINKSCFGKRCEGRDGGSGKMRAGLPSAMQLEGGGGHVEKSPLWVLLFQHLCICFVAFLQVSQPVLSRSPFVTRRIS